MLSARRIGNAAIVLRKLAKTREAETIPKAFLQLELAKEELVALRELVPTADEARLLVKHVRKPDDEPLIEAEALMMSLARLPRAAEKVDAGITRACFPETVEHILRAANLITAASLEIMASRRLARVLELLLAIGNQLNSNARAEIADAVGFSLTPSFLCARPGRRAAKSRCSTFSSSSSSSAAKRVFSRCATIWAHSSEQRTRPTFVPWAASCAHAWHPSSSRRTKRGEMSASSTLRKAPQHPRLALQRARRRRPSCRTARCRLPV